MLTQNSPATATLGQLLDPRSGKKPISGGSRDTEVNEPTTIPAGAPSAPAEVTTEPGTRVIRALLGIIEEGVASGEISTGASTVPVPRALRNDLRRVRGELGLGIDEAVLARGILLWSALFGAVSLELFGQYGEDTFLEPGVLFDHQMRLAVSTLRGS